MTLETLRMCRYCGTRYHVHKTTADLRLSFCSALCESFYLQGLHAHEDQLWGTHLREDLADALIVGGVSALEGTR